MRCDQIRDLIAGLYPEADWVEVEGVVNHRGESLAEGRIFREGDTREFSIKISLDVEEEEE